MKYWVTVATSNLQTQVDLLRESVQRFMPEHEFIHIDPPPSNRHIYRRAEDSRLRALIRLLADTKTEEVITSGADYLLYSPLYEIDYPEYKYKSALFVPHFLHSFPPVPHWLKPAVNGGQFNSDFQVWRPGPRVQDFLASQLILNNQEEQNHMLGQQILSFAQDFLGAKSINHAGYGVAYYNLHERIITPLGQVILAESKEESLWKYDLRTIHFSGMRFAPESREITEFNYPFLRTISEEEKGIYRSYQEQVRARTK